MVVTTYLSYFTAYHYFFKVGKGLDGAFQKIVGFNMEWLRFTDSLHIDIGVLLDPISVMMLVVISTISLMVHIYSLGYMKGDQGYSRFFAFLSLFTFSMLGLVVATNIFQMYMFWELVGLSSYLLIAHYYQKPSAVAASKKAFIVTRFADLGFLIGILILSYLTGTFDFNILCNPEGPAFMQSISCLFRIIDNGLGANSDFYGRSWKICYVPISYLAPRCYGRAYSSLCFNSCSNHGGCRSIFGSTTISLFLPLSPQMHWKWWLLLEDSLPFLQQLLLVPKLI